MPSPSEASTSKSNSPVPSEKDPQGEAPSFESLGLIPPLLTALEQLSFKKPTDIQAQVLPHALGGRDIIGVAETVGLCCQPNAAQ
jgi:ATP-dependent RNA helicase DDX47/RRP3